MEILAKQHMSNKRTAQPHVAFRSRWGTGLDVVAGRGSCRRTVRSGSRVGLEEETVDRKKTLN